MEIWNLDEIKKSNAQFTGYGATVNNLYRRSSGSPRVTLLTQARMTGVDFVRCWPDVRPHAHQLVTGRNRQ